MLAWTAALLAAALITTSSASAHELPDVTFPQAPDLHLEFEAAASVYSGNTSLTLLTDRAHVRYETGPHYGSFLLSHQFGSQGGERILNTVRALGQYRYEAVDLNSFIEGMGIGGEGIVHYMRDEFRRWEHLLQVGAGPYYQIWNTPRFRWNVTIAGVFEFEKFAKLTDSENPMKEVRDSQYELNSYRVWWGSELGWEIAKRVHYGQTVAFQMPILHCQCDTRAFGEFYLRVYGTDYFALQSGITALYDPVAPAQAKGTDFIIRSGLVFEL